jgi:hypothetical protein
MSRKEHHPSCEGHIDCPDCGPGSCARPVVLDGCATVRVVVCLSCWQRFAVHGVRREASEVSDPERG